MAGLSRIQNPATTGTNIGFDDDSDATAGHNLDAGPTTLYAVILTNANAAITYFSMWNSTAPVVGVDGQHEQIPIAASDTLVIVYPGGKVFSNGLSWATTTAGGTAAAVSPVTPIDVWFVTNGGN